MAAWQTILCGVDGSEESLFAAELSARIASSLSSELVCICVVPYHQVFRLGIHRGLGEQELVSDAEHLLARVKDETGVPLERVILEGDPAATILELAEERSCDLVVVGHRGLGAVGRWLLGSVATKVALHAPCPVLLSRGTGQLSESPLDRTLCAVDGSEESRRAAEIALDLVDALGGQMAFAHVAELPELHGLSPEGRHLLERHYQWPRELVAGFCEQARARGVDAEPVELTGQPASALLAYAAEWSATLIAAGSRGLGGFAGLGLGSVSHQLIRHAPCSVLISPPRHS